MTDAATASCGSCGATPISRFCAVAHFFEHAIETLTHFDDRSLGAVKYLLFRPGFLTREYLDGRRKPYVGPLQLFVIVNIVFALVGGASFRVPLSERDAAAAALRAVALAAFWLPTLAACRRLLFVITLQLMH